MRNEDPAPEYPRLLTEQEEEWIAWILPANRSGYEKFRELLTGKVVIGEGRRGAGEIILGIQNENPDFSSPLAPVVAYGVIETDRGDISITLRDFSDGQISLEIVSRKEDHVPFQFMEKRRWTYSLWEPGQYCPQCAKTVREISIDAGNNQVYTLAICVVDKRIWSHDSRMGMITLVPITNFYNELMLHKNIRDPELALDGKRLFTNLQKYSDEDLAYAFSSYSKLLHRLTPVTPVESIEIRKATLRDRLKRMFSK
ncbi:MAG: hypothetical protein ACHQQQ_08310 [Bacteroidota bacterium]